MPLVPPQSSKMGTQEYRLQSGAVVEYEQHGRPHLAFIVSEKKGKWEVLNLIGEEIDLPSNRLYLLPQAGAELPSVKAPRDEKLKALNKLESEAAELEKAIELEALWQKVRTEKNSLQVAKLCERLSGSNQLLEHLALRHALMNDKVFFKRDNQAFAPRPEEQVAELKEKAREEEAQRMRRENFLLAMLDRLNGGSAVLDENEIMVIAELAALGGKAERGKLAQKVIEEITERARLQLKGKPEERAFDLLVRVNYFKPDQDLNLVRYRRTNVFSPEVLAEAKQLTAHSDVKRVDLRDLPSITIDGTGTRDMDDAISVEKTPTGYRLGIHITDVAAFIPDSSLLFEEALRRATSIYAADYVVGMLPAELAESALSLVAGEERLAQSFILELDRDFEIISREVVQSTICVKRCWNYDEADEMLYNGNEAAEPDLFLLWKISSALEARRLNAGAQQFQRREMAARVGPDGKIRLESSADDTPSRKLIGEMMIVANETAGLFAGDHGLSAAFRGQEAPEGDIYEIAKGAPDGPAREYFLRSLLKRSAVETKPIPHYGLGLKAYVQVTSPIRRVMDLVCQIQFANYLNTGEPRYERAQFSKLIEAAEGGLIEAMRIQRDRSRYWLLRYIEQEKFSELNGTIVRVDRDKPIVEVDELFMLHPFKSREVMSGKAVPPSRLGQRVRLKIERLNPVRDYLILAEM